MSVPFSSDVSKFKGENVHFECKYRLMLHIKVETLRDHFKFISILIYTKLSNKP